MLWHYNVLNKKYIALKAKMFLSSTVGEKIESLRWGIAILRHIEGLLRNMYLFVQYYPLEANFFVIVKQDALIFAAIIVGH